MIKTALSITGPLVSCYVYMYTGSSERLAMLSLQVLEMTETRVYRSVSFLASQTKNRLLSAVQMLYLLLPPPQNKIKLITKGNRFFGVVGGN